MAEAIVASFKAAWSETPELHSKLKVVSQPTASPSPAAPGMLSAAGHYEFPDGARFRLRYSFDLKDPACFMHVEDDVGLRFGFLDDINSYLLESACDPDRKPEQLIVGALQKAVKMHTRANASNPSLNTTQPTVVSTLPGRRSQGKSAAYRIEDHPLAAMLAGHRPKSRMRMNARNPLQPAATTRRGAGAAAAGPVFAPAGPVFAPAGPAARAAGTAGPAENGSGGTDNRDAVMNDNNLNGVAAVNAAEVAAVAVAVAAAAAATAEEAAETAETSGSDKKRNEQSLQASMHFGSSPLASTTLMKQLHILEKQDTRADGFEAGPKDDDLYTWHVKLFFDDPDTSLARDLAKLPNHDHLDLEFKFSSSYPSEPPVVRFVAPAIVGGHVTTSGAICMELLTAAGWSPVNSIDVVCIQIRALLVAGNARVDVARPQNTERYTLEGALRDLSSIVFSHGWTVENGRVAKAAKRPRNETNLV